MIVEPIPTHLFHPWAKALLLGSFGFSLLRAIQGEKELSEPFESFALGLLALSFYPEAASVLQSLSRELVSTLGSRHNEESLRSFILKALENAESPTDASSTRGMIEQAWRAGVWGVLTLIVDWLFLLSSLLLECAQAVFWKLLLVLYPLGCGLYPVFPRILGNLSLYAVELNLWAPILILVNRITSDVAREYASKEGSLGLYVIAVELIAALLIFAVPAITHRFLSGALSDDFGSGGSLLATGKAWIAKSRWLTAKRGV